MARKDPASGPVAGLAAMGLSVVAAVPGRCAGWGSSAGSRGGTRVGRYSPPGMPMKWSQVFTMVANSAAVRSAS